MPRIKLKYGKSHVSFDYEESRFDVLGIETENAPLSDVEIGDKLDNPIDSPRIEEIVQRANPF